MVNDNVTLRQNIDEQQTESASGGDVLLSDTKAADSTIRCLNKSLKEVSADNEKLRWELARSQKHNATANRNIQDLERQVRDLKLELSENSAPLHREVTGQKKRIKDLLEEVKRRYDKGVKDALQSLSQKSEHLLLVQQREAWQAEAQKWKEQAMCKGAELISRCYQAAVDEGVRKEREKDKAVFRALREEIERLKLQLRRRLG